MAVWLATAVILAALSAVVAHADCGFDQLQRLNVQLNESVFVGRFRRDSNSGNQDFGDTRFRVKKTLLFLLVACFLLTCILGALTVSTVCENSGM
jgi:hypothetical protein